MEQTKRLRNRAVVSNLIFFVFLTVFITAVVVVGMQTYQKAFAFGLSGGPLSSSPPDFFWQATPTGDPNSTIILPTPTTAAAAGPVAKPWEGAERVTVLVVGLDYRDWEQNDGPPRTDTMILLTLDPLTQTAGVLNVPRDLWVNIPGFGYGRINTAYSLGEMQQYMGGGPGLAIDTVEALLGVEINYFAQIDFEAFERFIDEIGGVEIDVPEEIKVDPIGPHNTVVLDAGRQMLDGPVTLAYARARYTDGGDFDRARRQQQVIRAIRNQILKLDMLPSLIANGPALYSELSTGVHTNMDLEDAFSLAWLAQDVLDGNIREGIIAPPHAVLLGKSPDGTQDILIPVMTNVMIIRDEVFGASDPVTPGAENERLEELMRQEQARIVILNGSGVPGLAARTQAYLVEQGANVVLASDANEFYYYTTIIDQTGNPYTVRYIRGLMSIESNYRHMEYNPASDSDVIVYLGSDWSNAGILP